MVCWWKLARQVLSSTHNPHQVMTSTSKFATSIALGNNSTINGVPSHGISLLEVMTKWSEEPKRSFIPRITWFEI